MAKCKASSDDILRLAKYKLLLGKDFTAEGKYAIYSVRLLLDVELWRESIIELQSKLVQSHMRVIYSIPQHRCYMRTGTPSEPILAEAAAQAMYLRALCIR